MSSVPPVPVQDPNGSAATPKSSSSAAVTSSSTSSALWKRQNPQASSSRPVRVIKTRSMTSSARVNVAFGGSIPPKTTSKPRPKPCKRKAPNESPLCPRAKTLKLRDNKLALNQSQHLPSEQASSVPQPKPSSHPTSVVHQCRKRVTRKWPDENVAPADDRAAAPSEASGVSLTSKDGNDLIEPSCRHPPPLSRPQISLPSNSQHADSTLASGDTQSTSKASFQVTQPHHSGPGPSSFAASNQRLMESSRSSNSRQPLGTSSFLGKVPMPAKRLFEEIDYTRHDIFSFLDPNPAAKSDKVSRRTVFKSQRPCLKPDRLLPTPKATTTKRAVLASNKLLAGVPSVKLEPVAKRLKKGLPECPISASTAFTTLEALHSSTESSKPSVAGAHDLRYAGENSADAQAALSSTSATIPEGMRDPSNSAKPAHTASPIPAVSQPVEYLPREDSTVSERQHSVPTSDPSPQTQPCSSASQCSPIKQACEATSTSLLPLRQQLIPVEPAVHASAKPEESSTDEIDFLSPKKKVNLLVIKDDQVPIPLLLFKPADSKGDQTPISAVGTLKTEDLSTTSCGHHATFFPHEDTEAASGNCTPIHIPRESSACAPADCGPITESPAQSHEGLESISIFQPLSRPVRSGAEPQSFPHEPSPPATGVESTVAVDETATSLQVGSPPATLTATQPATMTGDSAIPLHLSPTAAPQALKASEPKNFPPTPKTLDSKALSSASKTPDSKTLSPAPKTPDSEALSSANMSPRSSPKFIPKRISPIKQPTLPTSIPISSGSFPKSTPSKIPTLSSTAHPLSQIPQAFPVKLHRGPTMLPRRALKPSMGTTQPLAFNVITSLDAIVENSPEKRPIRDALGAASLNRYRGAGVPPKTIFSGGIKSQSASTFSLNATPHATPWGSETYQVSAPVHPQGPIAVEDQVLGPSNQRKLRVEPVNGGDESSELSELSSNLSHSSIISHQSRVSNDSDIGGNNSSANISPKTQARLTKLQRMLTKLGGPRTGEHDMSLNSSNHITGHTDKNEAQYEEYEVSLKDEDHQLGDGLGHRKTRSRSCSISSTTQQPSEWVDFKKSSLNSSVNSRGAVNRRASNILPTAQITVGEKPKLGLSSHESQSTMNGGSHPLQQREIKLERAQKANTLKDTVVYVDVRTAEGDDAGKVFVEMLKALGAKVVGRVTFPLTHIIFKAGRQATIDRWLAHPQPKPHLVGIGWVVRCRELLSKASEAPYVIDIHLAQAMSSSDRGGSDSNRGKASHSNGASCSGMAGFHHRRKSMEPKALSIMASGLQIQPGSTFDGPAAGLSQSCIASAAPATANTSAMMAYSIEKVRRKSLQFLPKVGSPLANRVDISNTEASESHD